MTVPPRDTPGGPHAVTLVVDMPVTKLDALDVIAFVADAVIDNAGTAFPRVGLAPDAWAEVQIPKFADPPPLAIDVCSDISPVHAQQHADRLAAALTRVGWTVRPARGIER
ncbi:hypothetical protein NQ156_02310 [Microbacterium sp. zg.Y625]|uniref:hypothetical protein n=1 Tax=Microbacterium jiangjiandongii TaxID=3049071 RepID=UPI00214C6114|nr:MULTISPECIES: hypothetical protein [unclassified Microbacterium]MCR2791890.1 hypothetical protein [Microbacterium sp. zg.Y625]MCR2815285.1 hypothetical protein [Microbacterium sp. zg.Y843]WIM24704.1 hypothetical protein QNO14_11220 [Microbacterium sp. zg-Y625]